MKNKVLLVLLILLVLPFVSSLETLGTFKQSEQVRIAQVCSTATYINISSVTFPNSTTAVSNIRMTSSGSGEFYYNFTNTSTLGRYDVRGVSDGCEKTFATWFEITATGKELTSAKATSYVIIIIISVLIFLGLLWIGIALPSNNKRDDFTGYIIAIRNIKYLKFTMLGLSYIFLIWITYFFWMIVYAYLDFNFLSTIFRFIFTFLAILTLPLFILFCYLTISNLIKDSKVGDMLLRGLKTR